MATLVDLTERARTYDTELRALRRDLHAHPELARAEVRTTGLLADRLAAAGLAPRRLPGTGLVCDIGSGPGLVALRADLDALPLPDLKTVPYRSTVPGVAHACGHDVHVAAVLGAGLVLADLAAAGALSGAVRLVFQPAEEVLPGGALDVINAGGIEGVDRILALHCDPRLPVGRVGLRAGPITAASDKVVVTLTGPGGHSARPHLTADLTYALGKVLTDTAGVLSRRVDPRAGLSLVWGHVAAGSASNVIPREGVATGSVRCLDPAVWETAPDLIRETIAALVAPYRVSAEVEVVRGVPPCDNERQSVALLAAAARDVLGPGAAASTEQSLGGEDFAWYLYRVPGALARLGVASPGTEGTFDLHQSTFDVDEDAIGVGVRLLVGAALRSSSWSATS
ncbi:MAG: amidohydrolase [Sporichthyaceae bacterium]